MTSAIFPLPASAQENNQAEDLNQAETDTETLEEDRPIAISAGPARKTVVGQSIQFNLSIEPYDTENIRETFWDFGDGTRTTGNDINHTYKKPGTYSVTVKVTTNEQQITDTTEVKVFEHVILLVSDSSASEDQVELQQQQAAKSNILLVSLQAKGGGPEVLVEEDLTKQLIDVIPTVNQAHIVALWTSGSVGTNVLTQLSQHLKQSEGITQQELDFKNKGIVLLSETPYGALAPSAQSAFDQLQPSYVLLARPEILDTIITTTTAEEARNSVVATPLDYRLLGTFSARTVSDLGVTNAFSFGINYLINRGVPINSIVLILMLPVIATILAFARQVIGIKAFGLVTPAMTTVSFLVMGLQYGLIVFASILLAGTITRLALRRLHLLYLPRMALVLTSVSLSLLLVLALGVANDRSSILSFSIFPALILTILAEEFIAAQFKQGIRTALTVTGWTLVLSTFCYFIVSSELFRTLIISYPEIILATIPINIALGQWSGLRLTELFRFRNLLRHEKLPS